MTADRLRVFVSSKMQELAPERAEVRISLDELQVDAWVFEKDAGARAGSIQQTYLGEVENADLYIGVFWKGHGDYTIEEFEHARKLGKDCLVYEKREDLDQRNAKLKEFLDRIGRVETGLTVQWFHTPEELGEFVKRDVARWQTEIVRRHARSSDVTAGTKKTIDRMAPRQLADITKAPYKFLSYYDIGDRDIFFGRDTVIEELAGKIPRHKVLIINGQSGSGKTSLINAGLIPRLAENGYLYVYFRDYTNPLEQLREYFRDHPDFALPDADKLSLLQILRTIRSQQESPVVVIFDQFERFLINVAAAPRREFLQQLRECLDSDLTADELNLVISLRDDFFGKLLLEAEAIIPTFGTDSHHHNLRTLSRDEARQAIIQPLKNIPNIGFDGKFVDDVLLPHLMGAGGTEGQSVQPETKIEPPHLQIVCNQLYESARDRSGQQLEDGEPVRIGFNLYHDLGETEGMLRDYLDDVVRRITNGDPKQIAVVRSTLKLMIETIGTRKFESLADISANLPDLTQSEIERIVGRLQERRVVEAKQIESVTAYSLSHEIMVAKVESWFDEREMLRRRAQETLERGLAEWNSTNALLNQTQVENIRRWLPDRLLKDAERLLEESERTIKEQKQRAAEQQQRLDVARKRTRTARRIAIVVAAILIPASIGFGIWGTINADKADREAETAQKKETEAVKAKNDAIDARKQADTARIDAEKSARNARIRYLVSEANAQKNNRPQRSLLLAARAVEMSLDAGERPIPAAEQTLRDLLGSLGGMALPAPEGPYQIDLSADDRWLAAWSDKASPRIWDLKNINHNTQPIVLPAHRGGVDQLKFTPDSHWLVMDGHSDDLLATVHDYYLHAPVWKAEPTHLWDLTAADPFSLPKHKLGAPINNGTLYDSTSKLSPNGRWLVTQNSEIRDGKSKPFWTRHDLSKSPPVERRFPSTVELGQDHDSLATVERRHPFGPFSFDEQWLVLYSMTKAYLWKLSDTDRTTPVELPANKEMSGDTSFSRPYFDARFSPDGRWLILQADGLHFFNLQPDDSLKHIPIEDIVSDLENSVFWGVSDLENSFFSGDGDWLVTHGGRDCPQRLWDLCATDPTANPYLLEEAVYDKFSSDGAFVAGGGFLLPIRDRVPAHSPIELSGTTMSFSPSNQWLCTGNQDGITRLWNTSTIHDEQIRFSHQLRGHSGRVKHIRFTSAGNRVITSTIAAHSGLNSSSREVAHTVIIWDTVELQPVRLIGHEATVQQMIVTSDDRQLITSDGDGPIRLWDLQAENPAAEAPARSIEGDGYGGIDAAISPNSRWLVLAEKNKSNNWNVRVAGLADPKPVSVVVPIPETTGGDVHVQMDPGSRFCTIAFGKATENSWMPHLKAIYFLNLMEEPANHRVTTLPNAHTKATFSPDEKWLAAHSDKHKVLVWKLNGEGLAEPPKTVPGNLMLFGEDNRTLLTAEQDKMWCWDLENLNTARDTFTVPSRVQNENPTPVEVIDLKFSKNDRWLAMFSNQGDVHLWHKPLEPQARQHQTIYEGSDETWEGELHFDPDGNWLAARDTSDVILWRLNGRSASVERYELAATGAGWNDGGPMAFSPDGKWLVIGDTSEETHLWNLTAQDPESQGPIRLSDADDGLSALAMHLQSGLLARGFKLSFPPPDASTEIHLMNIEACETSTESVALRGSKAGIKKLLISNDQRWLVSIEKTRGGVKLWKLDINELVEDARLTAGREFTSDERARYSIGETAPKTATDPRKPLSAKSKAETNQ